jgi:endonuclease/exonuclease/phosphatase family metal-dependent hydrolase
VRKIVSSSLQFLQAVVSLPLQKLGLLAPSDAGSQDAEPWEYSERRMNAMLTAVLRDKESGVTFGIANYHMPCSYWDARIMTLHADLCLAHVQRVAQRASSDDSNPVPYILAGDFNLKPGESIYRYLTTGAMHPDDPAHPGTKAGVSWAPSIREHVRSAYAVMQGKEPDFTNYAQVPVRDSDPFIDTLDYIFLSQAWKVDKVRELPTREESGGPFPNLDRGEPSDHVLIAASLSIPSK